MKKVSKAILIGLAIVVALVAALLVGLNLYIQSPGAQARIQEELSKALRLPLKITNTSVSPWSDLRITGISIPNGDANFLEAASFSARYRLLPLLEGKLIITDMRVENPKVVWVQNADGQWKLPSAEKAAKEAREEAPVVEKEPKKPEAEPKKKNFAVVIDRFEVKDGAFDMLDKDRHHVVTFTGVNMVYTKLTAEHIEGTADIVRAVWADGLTLENLRTPFSYVSSNQEFWLPDITANLADGPLRGNYRSHVEGKHTPFTTKLEFERVNMDKLVAQSGGETGQASGTLQGTLEMHGETDRMEKVEGTGHLDLREGRFRQFELFQTIGRILNIQEFADFRIRQGLADFRVAGEKIFVEKLDLQASSLDITATGTIRIDKTDKKIALNAQLAVDEAIVARLPGKVPEAFASNGQGRRTIDFTVGGTTARPKTNLGDKLISQTLNAQFGSLLGTIFDQKKEEDQERKREEERRKKEEDERKKAEKKDKKKKDKDKEKDRAKEAASPDTAPATPPAPAPPAPATPAAPGGAPSPTTPPNP